jgi:hypothetical protein
MVVRELLDEAMVRRKKQKAESKEIMYGVRRECN